MCDDSHSDAVKGIEECNRIASLNYHYPVRQMTFKIKGSDETPWKREINRVIKINKKSDISPWKTG